MQEALCGVVVILGFEILCQELTLMTFESRPES
jgi:hypothetical protein